MDNFLAAQASNPFSPTSMLIQADWMEERGDIAGAAALRGLASGGYPSLASLALEVSYGSAIVDPDDGPLYPNCTHGWDEAGDGSGDGYRFGERTPAGTGIGDVAGIRFGADCGCGEGDGNYTQADYGVGLEFSEEGKLEGGGFGIGRVERGEPTLPDRTPISY